MAVIPASPLSPPFPTQSIMSSSSSSSPPPRPQAKRMLSEMRNFRPRRQKQQQHHLQSKRTSAQVGTRSIVPSDSAFVDYYLSEESNDDQKFDLRNVFLYCNREFVDGNGYGDSTTSDFSNSATFHIKYKHELLYRGDVVWRYETTCYGDAMNQQMFGETITCHLTSKALRVRIGHKSSATACSTSTARKSTIATTRTWHEQYTFKIDDILRKSAQEYHNAVCVSSSTASTTTSSAVPSPTLSPSSSSRGSSSFVGEDEIYDAFSAMEDDVFAVNNTNKSSKMLSMVPF